jgi:conjugal transfer pilus assembly protein TraA
MQSVIKYSGRAELAILALVALAFALLLFAGPAFAGADTTFDTALTKFTDFLEGSGGKIITVLSLAGGIVALASGRFSMGQIAIRSASVWAPAPAFRSSPRPSRQRSDSPRAGRRSRSGRPKGGWCDGCGQVRHSISSG